MATLNIEFRKFNRIIRLNQSKRDELIGNRNALRTKIRDWFNNNKEGGLQPKFSIQGSFLMNTIINPLPEKYNEGRTLYKYDLDDGVYFIERGGENNKESVQTWHNWVYRSVDGHTEKSIDKTTCVRVVYSDGHHIDLPIYYKGSDIPQLAHKSKGWLDSDPKEFAEWFNDNVKAFPQIRRLTRFLKAWKNFRELENSNLKLPSGFILSILIAENYVKRDRDDESFRKTVANIIDVLEIRFLCFRPTTPSDEDLFADYSRTKRNDFISNLKKLLEAFVEAEEEDNYKLASEYIIKQFGNRFPLGKDQSCSGRKNRLAATVGNYRVKPYGY